MNSSLRFIFITALTTPLLSCNEGGGLQQRIAELEAQRDAKIAELQRATKEVTELKSKLEQRGGPSTAAPAASAAQTNPTVTVEAAPEELPAGYISAVRELERSLKEKVKPLSLTAYPKTIFAGFVSKGADGSHHGVAVPFFAQDDGATWVMGYSLAELLPELSGKNQVPAPKPQPVAQTPTPPKPAATPPPVTETPVTPPVVAKNPVNPIKPITPVSPNGDPPRDERGVILLNQPSTTPAATGTMPNVRPSNSGAANAVKGGNVDPAANVGSDGVFRFPGGQQP